jgi:hypothetical protein
VLLLAGYGVQRAICPLGLPDDCLVAVDFYEVFSDITDILLYGVALGWFVGIAQPSRAAWLFSRRRWWFFAVFLGTPPVYSAMSNIPALKHSISAGDPASSWGDAFLTLEATAAAAVALAITWHLRAAWRRGGPYDFAMYALSRLLVLGWFGAAAERLARDPGSTFHLHHLYLGWALALWAEFNSPISALALAIGAGIFCQGVGAYSFAPVFTDGGCFVTPTMDKVACSFWAKEPFTLRVCPAVGGAAPAHKCT